MHGVLTRNVSDRQYLRSKKRSAALRDISLPYLDRLISVMLIFNLKYCFYVVY